MSTKYGFHNPEGLYYITWTIIDWVPVLTRPAYRNIIFDSFNYCIDKKGLIIHAYVLMHDHTHLIASTKEGFLLKNITRDFKRHTAGALLDAIQTENESRRNWMLYRFNRAGALNPANEEYQVWQNGSHAEELTSHEWVMQKLNYIHQNPVRAGWVDEAEHFPHSSARDYASKPGPVKLELLF